MGTALFGLPGAQLCVQVVQRQAQEPWHVGLHPGQAHADATSPTTAPATTPAVDPGANQPADPQGDAGDSTDDGM